MDEEDIKGKTESFLSHMTTVTTLEKNELLNVFQYVLLVIIPLALFLKFMKEYIPPDSASKSSMEITVEVVVQLCLIFTVFWLIHKVILYIPTYSTVPYEKLNLIQLVMPVVFLLFCMKSSISEKVSILLDRALTVSGIKSEAMTDAEKEKEKKKAPMVMPPPQMTHSMAPQAQMPQMSPMNPHESFGIQEPMASNEMGGPYMNY